MEIGKNIAKFRKEKNLTQEELAKKICVSPKTLSSYENNRNLPNIEMLILLSDTLGVSINDLLGSNNEILEKYQKQHITNTSIILLICGLSCIFFMLFEYLVIGSLTYQSDIKQFFDNGLRGDLFGSIILTGIWYLIISFALYLIWYVSYKRIKNYKLYEVLITIFASVLIIISLLFFSLFFI